MEITFVASNYPTEKKQVHVFLDNVVRKFTDLGITCNVIAPQSWYSCLRNRKFARSAISQRRTEKGNVYTVYSPRYTVFPIVKLGKLCLADFSKKSFYRALKRTYRKYNFKSDVIYAHFIQAGVPAVMLAEYLKLPSFIANGEADTIGESASLSHNLVKNTLEKVTGIISVSTKNKDEIVSLYGSEEILKKVRIIVNSADSKLFYKKDKLACRQKFGFPENAFIIAYTGSFIKRKGTRLLSSALERFDDVYSIFIGVGEDKPTCKNILHTGRVNNKELADYLNAADMFVLPTLAEGCCNAIVEAVSCGLPVVSSDRAFNHDILDESCAILIDPTDEDAIYQAIKRMKEDETYRESLANGSMEKAKSLSLDVRVEKLLSFISDMKN